MLASTASIKLFTWRVSVFGLIATFGITAYEFAGLYRAINIGDLLLLAWALLPYGLLAVAANFAPSHKGSIIVLAIAVISVVFAGSAYIDAYFIHRDAETAWAIVFVPLQQNIASITVLVAIMISRLRARSPTSNVPIEKDNR
jgi:predicted permease